MIEFRFIEKISNVKSFDLNNGDLFCLKGDMTISGLSGLDLGKIGTKHIGRMFIVHNFLIWQDGRGKSAVYDLKSNTLVFSNSSELNEYTFRRLDLNDDDLLVVDTWTDDQEHLCYFHIGDAVFQQIDFNINCTLSNGNILLDIDKDTEIRRITLGGKIIWEYTISGKYLDIRGEECRSLIKNVLGVYNDILWLSLTSGELVGIDIQTGKHLYRLGFNEISEPNFPYQIQADAYLPFGDLMQLDEEKGEIIGLRNEFFIKLDLNRTALNREYINVSETMKACKISSSYRNLIFPSDEGHIYFCDDRQGKIGVFDRHKLEVIWSHELEIEHDGIAQILEMKYEDNRWYVLDRNDVLHIFERV
jgi:hypothetical protein